jgi:hypothetical protein
MLRRHPELRVRNVGRKFRISRGDPPVARTDGSGRLTRFGRTSFHKSYDKAG